MTMSLRRQVVEQKDECLINRWRFKQVVIIQHEDDFILLAGGSLSRAVRTTSLEGGCGDTISTIPAPRFDGVCKAAMK
jgi:hypothetical protein